MKISISHLTHYMFTEPANFGLQRLQLRPQSNKTQKILRWEIHVEGAQKQLAFVNALENNVELLKVNQGAHELKIIVEGEVETTSLNGVDDQRTSLPNWLFLSQTQATHLGKELKPFCKDYENRSDTLPMLHELMSHIRGHVDYVIGATNVATTAEESFAMGKGVCQDHAHIMITIARTLGLPARYVSGYLLMDGVVNQEATHAWCEVYVLGLGWVGFDVSNGICPDERYVKIATGRDYLDAAPIKGIRYGDGKEKLEVQLQIQQ